VKIEVSFEYGPKVYVYQREKGWYWKFKLPNGAWFYGSAPGESEQAVKRNAERKERELAKGLFSKKEINKLQQSSRQLITFEQAIDHLIDHLKSEGASPNYTFCLKKQLISSAAVFRDQYRVTYVHKLTEEDAYQYRKHLLDKVKDGHIKKVTAFRQLNDVKRLFKWLRKRKWIPEDPWREIDPITVPKEEKARNRAPTIDIVQKLMAADYEHRYGFPVKEFAYGLFRTGARKEELLYLEVGDVNWQTGLWVIRPKDCPTRFGAKWSPKYGKTRETIIPGDVLKQLEPLVRRAQEHRVVGYAPDPKGKLVPEDAKFIFTMKDRQLSTKRKTVYRRMDCMRGAWGALFVAAGISEPGVSSSPSTLKYRDGKKVRKDLSTAYTRHDMRRGFNLAAREAGMSLDDRSLILGHGREVNETHYCGKPQLDMAKISEILNSHS
jgi:integrase